MSIGLFLKNFSYLSRFSLKELNRQARDLRAMIDNIPYELPAHLNAVQRPAIRTFEETVEDLIAARASISRFGDGEMRLMEGEGIAFQESDPRLAERLKQVIAARHPRLFTGINYHYYYADLGNLVDSVRHFCRCDAPALRARLGKYLLPEKTYHAAGFTAPYFTFKDYDFAAYYRRLRALWQGRDITLVCGEGVTDKLKHDIFDNAASLSRHDAPSKNAFAQYDQILQKARGIPKDHLVLLILGPTATVLAHDLALEGYQALDIGHLAKDYDAFMRAAPRDARAVADFFAPD